MGAQAAAQLGGVPSPAGGTLAAATVATLTSLLLIPDSHQHLSGAPSKPQCVMVAQRVASVLLALLLALAAPQPLEAGLVEVVQRVGQARGRQLLAPNECASKGLQGTCNGCVVSASSPWRLADARPAVVCRPPPSPPTRSPLPRLSSPHPAVLLLHGRRRCRHVHPHRHLHLRQGGGDVADMGHCDPQVLGGTWDAQSSSVLQGLGAVSSAL